ncbi:MAG: hypothetical protein K0U93_10570 [Gammaproteobacteria bacterium]|nr:hypothetical protein [Gammaproteobacteria bacterium]
MPALLFDHGRQTAKRDLPSATQAMLHFESNKGSACSIHTHEHQLVANTPLWPTMIELIPGTFPDSTHQRNTC